LLGTRAIYFLLDKFFREKKYQKCINLLEEEKDNILDQSPEPEALELFNDRLDYYKMLKEKNE